MTAEAIAKVLGGRKAGAAWMVRCPAHDDREPSLAITDARDGKVLVRCHAGCNQQDVIAALRVRGVWDTGDKRPIRFSRRPDREPPFEPDSDATRRTEAALAIWRGSQSVTGGGAPYIHIGRVVLCDPDDLDAWLAAHRRKFSSDRG
jgi:putative DNA primase/helicase